MTQDRAATAATPIGAVVTDDPADHMTAEEQARMQFHPRLIRPSPMEVGAGALREMQDLEGLLLHMHFGAGNEPPTIDGSAVMVAPGVALCALHVLEPHAAALRSGVGGALCVGMARAGLQLWRLRNATGVPNTDLAIIGLSYSTHLPADYGFSLATISTRMPNIEERLTLTGFRAHGLDDLQDNAFAVRGEVLVSIGTVTAQYPTGRDSFLMPWPALEVDCAAWGGMSGGPVFDESGHLVGLVCSSVSGAYGENSPSYVSLLWPALVQTYAGGWPTQVYQGTRKLLQSDRRVCQIDRPQAITIDGDNVHYIPWS